MYYRYDIENASWTIAHEDRACKSGAFPHYASPFERLRLPGMRFSFYDAWEGANVECPNCGWRGTLKSGGEYLGSGFEIKCGDCFHALAHVLFPAKEEAIAANDTSTIMMFEVMESRTERFERNSLKDVGQLPEIDEQEFVLRWDTVERENPGTESYTLIMHHDQAIFKELAFFEGGFRYEPVARILIQKYGHRLKDVVPTHMGWLYLGGDSYASLRKAQDARQELFGKPN